jgi:steroid 5-alpha reductase family enzyme
MKQSFYIDTHKGITGVVVAALMMWCGREASVTAWISLALHGTYGVLWVWKSRVFPDSQWERRAPLWFGLAIWGGLSTYWVAPWLVMTSSSEAPPWLLGVAVMHFGLGVFLHFASDMQKHMHLQHRRGQLLDDGLWSRSRNPNYLGELFIYFSFVLVARHWLPAAILLLWLVAVWSPNMRKKDRSLSRYPTFASWRAQTGLMVWRLRRASAVTDVSPDQPAS